MAEKSEDSVILIFAIGAILGGLLAWKFLKTRQQQTQTQAPPVMTAAGGQPQYRQDTEFIKWYTDTIIKPSIERAAKESADTAIRQFMAANPPSEVQISGAKTPIPKARPKPVLMIKRNAEGFIETVEPIKRTTQNDYKPREPNMITWLKSQTGVSEQVRVSGPKSQADQVD